MTGTLEDLNQILEALPARRINNKYSIKEIPRSQLSWVTFDFWKAVKDEAKKKYNISQSNNQFTNNQWYIQKWIDNDKPQPIAQPVPITQPQEITQEKIIKNDIDLTFDKQLEFVKTKLPESIEIVRKSILHDYQQDHVIKNIYSYLNYNVFIDLSDMGIGKTLMTLVLCKAVNLIPIVICPKVIAYNWFEEAKKIDLGEIHVANYALAKGGKELNLYIKRNGKEGLKKVKSQFMDSVANPMYSEQTKKYQPRKIIKYNVSDNYIMIFDEAQYTKNKSARARILVDAKKSGIKLGCLSATLIESPLKMYGISNVLGFWNEDWEYFTEFLPKWYCEKRVINRFGQKKWIYDGGLKGITELREKIIGEGRANRLSTDLLRKMGKFPKTHIMSFPIMLKDSDEEEIEKLYAELAEKVEVLIAKKNELSRKEFEHQELALRQKYRQIIELKKLPYIKDMAECSMAEGKSVVIFLNYVDSVLEMGKMMKTNSLIYGMNKENRENMLNFQANRNKIIICSTAGLAGINLHDQHGTDPRVALFTVLDDAVGIKQGFGRVDRNGGTDSDQYIMFCKNTIEEKVAVNLEIKIRRIETFNDGKSDFNLTSKTVKSLDDLFTDVSEF